MTYDISLSNNLLFLTPLGLILCGLVCFLYKDKAITIALFGSICTIFAVLQSYYNQESLSYVFGAFPSYAGIEFVADNYSKVFITFLTVPLFFILLSSRDSIVNSQSYGLLMIASGGFAGMALSSDLFNIYVFMEITSLSSYALVALSEKRDSSYSAFNYLIIGTIGATLYLLGIGLIYSITGALNLDDIKSILIIKESNHIELWGYGLITTGLLIKIGLFPCHFWMPKIYRNINHYLAAFFSIVSSNSMFFVLIKLLKNCFVIDHINGHFSDVFSYLAIASILYGSIYACFKRNIKESLAYSSISNYGLVLLAIFSGMNDGFTIAFIILIGHGIAKSGAFLSIKSENKLYLSLFLMSLIGVPPMIGFYAKWSLIKLLWLTSPVAIFIILTSSIMSLYYSLKIIENISIQPAGNIDKSSKIARWSMLLILLALSVNVKYIIKFLVGVNYVSA